MRVQRDKKRNGVSKFLTGEKVPRQQARLRADNKDAR